MTLNEWIIFGKVGTSSKTMWAALTGTVTTYQQLGGTFDVPYDGSDFGRCYQLVKECSVTKEQLQKVVEVFKWWKPFIDNWDKLSKMYETKEGNIREAIKPLVEEARILDGWVNNGNGSWSRDESRIVQINSGVSIHFKP